VSNLYHPVFFLFFLYLLRIFGFHLQFVLYCLYLHRILQVVILSKVTEMQTCFKSSNFSVFSCKIFVLNTMILIAFWTIQLLFFLEIIHRPVLNLKQCFRDRILSPSLGKNLRCWTQSIELVPVCREREMDIVQKHNNCINTQLSQNFRSYLFLYKFKS
jgi:hypothetical protein